jgi:hypothetical protein
MTPDLVTLTGFVLGVVTGAYLSRRYRRYVRRRIAPGQTVYPHPAARR